MSRLRGPFARILPLTLLLCAASARPSAAQFPQEEAIRAILKERVEAGRNAGLVLGLRDAGGTRVIAAGTPGDGVKLDGDTIFEIGSTTKTFTAVLLADMVVRGQVRLDDPISRFLPAGVQAPSRNGKPITLLDLATQTSGLPRLPANMSPRDRENPYADYTVEALYAFLSGYRLARDPGETYEYSNLGFGLLGHLLSLRAGVGYEELVLRRILEPLKMNATGIALTRSMKTRLASGHDAEGRAVANWDIPTLAGAGALRSSVNDLLRFVAAQVSPGEGDLAAAIAMTHAPRHPTDRAGVEIALAWHVLHRPGHDILWHNGGTAGYHAFIGFEEKSGRGVVLLSNSAANTDDIGCHLLDPSYPLAKQKAR